MKNIIFCLFYTLLTLHFVYATEQKRPNIVFAFADDWGCYSTSYAEIEKNMPWNEEAPTPNLDRLYKEGVLFRNAYVSSPQCTPSRSSLLSGMNFWETGLAAVQDGIWDFQNPSFPMLMRAAGYHAGYSSKVWSPGVPRDAPFGGSQYEYESAGTDYDKFSQEIYKRIDKGMSIEDAKKELYAQVKGNFESFLKDRKANQPFLYWFGGRNPHRTWIKGSGKKLWNIDPDKLKGKMPPYLPDVHAVREDFADYFGENMAFDGAIGVLLKKLEEMGELENTIVVASGDHGAPGFPYGKCNQYDFGTRVCLAVRWGKITKQKRVVDDFINLMDLAPTFLEAGEVAIPQSMSGKSMIPQLLSTQEGQIDPARTWVVTGRERHVPHSRNDLMPYPQRSYRTKDYSYIINFKPDRWPGGSPNHITATETPDWNTLEKDVHYTLTDMDAGPTKAFVVTNRHNPKYKKFYDLSFEKRPNEELYDLKKDPHEMNNLANDPNYKGIKAMLRSKLMKVLNETNDPRVIGDGSRFDKMPYTFRKWDPSLDNKKKAKK